MVYLIKVVLEVVLCDGLSSGLRLLVAQPGDVDGRDQRVFRRLERRHLPGALHELFGDGIVVAVVAVADVLLRQRIVRIRRSLVSASEKSNLIVMVQVVRLRTGDLRDLGFIPVEGYFQNIEWKMR